MRLRVMAAFALLAAVWAPLDAAGQAIAPTPATMIAPGSPVIVELVEPVSSRSHKRGDRFAIRLAAPVTLDGKVVLPTGTTGIGEVVDAGSAGMLGKPAKLVLAARYLNLDGRHVPLRTLRLGAVGKDNTNSVMVGSFVPYAGLLAIFIRGGEIEIPAGALAQAKLAEGFAPDTPPQVQIEPTKEAPPQ